MEKSKKLAAIIIALSCSFILSACTPTAVAIGAASSIGLAAAQEGGISRAVTDNVIQLRIADKWLQKDFDIFSKLDLNIREGRVLITGSVPNPDMRVEAVRLAWQVGGVKQILNEIKVDDGDSLTTMLADSIITGSIKTKILFDKKIDSINYSIDTTDGNVYIMGIARDRKELSRVLKHAKETKMVTNVISYVHMSDDEVDDLDE